MPVLISTAQSRHKDVYAPASDLGLTLRSNGEEAVKVIDDKLNVVLAGILPPTATPTVADAGSGNLTNGKWVVYQYVYAATTHYPFVFDPNPAGGSEAPRSNGSPSSNAYQITGAGDRKTDVTVAYTTRTDISEIWLYRTALFDTQTEAETQAAGGFLYFIAAVDNNTAGGTVAIEDDVLSPVDPIGLDNFPAPEFWQCVYDGQFFWGWGNPTFRAYATYTNAHSGSTALLTLTMGDTWFDGRDGQNVTIAGVTTGGYDGQGTFRFKWLTSTTATLYTTDPATPVALPSTGASTVTIQGPATTLYRSKASNPFAWGYTVIVGDGTPVPAVFGERIGGGYGSSIAIVPNEQLLVLGTRYPNKTFTLNLGAGASIDQFFGTKRTISDTHSFSNFHSVFNARVGASNVLRGIDYDNLEVVQCNGISMNQVLPEISPMLRDLTENLSRQELAHGVYDPVNQQNALWLTKANSLSLVDFGILEDTKTGSITTTQEHDLLSSASISNIISNRKEVLGGTQTGIYGTILTQEIFSNWTSTLTGLVSGTVASATTTTITRAGLVNFDSTGIGLVGNWCLITDANGENEVWARISAASTSVLTFDLFDYGTGVGTAGFSPTPSAGWLFYIGVIECLIRKYFDLQAPATDKKLVEQWVTMRNADGTLIRYFMNRNDDYAVQYIPQQEENYPPTSVVLDEGADAWSVKGSTPGQSIKTFGIEIINRNYSAWQFYNTVLKLLPFEGQPNGRR